MIRLLAALALATAGCAWFDDGSPSRTCRSDRDCFAAQGEVCVPATHTCEQVDAASVAPAAEETP